MYLAIVIVKFEVNLQWTFIEFIIIVVAILAKTLD